MGQQGKMHGAFQRWRKGVWREYDTQAEGKEEREGRIERKRTYGIKHWGRVRTISRIHIQVRNFFQMGIGLLLFAGNVKTLEMGASGSLRLTSSQEELIPYHTIH
eukprot:6211980-Pleurochrysis_carterae.AAC.2